MEKELVNTINKIISTRRSMYPQQFTDEKIPDYVIDNLLENANWAPTHKLTEPWRFVVFSGRGLEKLADFQSDLYKTKTEKFDEFKYKKLKAKPLQASHVIAICMKRDEKESIPEIEEIESVACAVQNMYLTASAYGLACYWGSGGVTYLDEAKPFFSLGGKDKLLGFFYLGYPKISKPEGKRGSIIEKVSWVRD